MNRRDTALALLALVIAPLLARAQPARPFRVTYIGFGSPEGAAFLFDVFKKRLRELGYLEGKNVAFEERWAMSKVERLPDLAADVVALKPDVIVALNSLVARAVQRATTTIPIVFATISDPVGIGLVKSLAHPGGNITGHSTLAADFSPKMLELLRTAVPKLSHIAILFTPEATALVLKNMRDAVQSMGAKVLAIEVQTPQEIETAFARIAHEQIRGVAVLPSGLFTQQRRQIAELAMKHRIASVFPTRAYAEAGGLMSYGSNYADEARHAASYVDKILRGARPADLPVEQAMTLGFVINKKTARVLGLTLSSELLLRADEVIE